MFGIESTEVITFVEAVQISPKFAEEIRNTKYTSNEK